MQFIQQFVFLIITGIAIMFFIRNVKNIRRNILLGQKVELEDNKSERWKRVLLLALGQKKMFKYPLVAVMHFIIYLGFFIINLEILEIVLDGVLGTHRLFVLISGPIYSSLINAFEFLALAVLVSCIIFLVRRNVIKVDRLHRRELEGWPQKDANIILVTEIVLMTLFLVMNASDKALQLRQYPGYPETSDFLISGVLTPVFEGMTTQSILIIERTCWWLHIIGVLSFLNYLPYSKHLHIVLGFPNTYYASIKPMGKFRNMKEIQNEVLFSMQPEISPGQEQGQMKFGAKDVADLTWKNLMDAYSCTECGRCTAACPANITGKKLNPRKIMMDTRDRLEEIGRNHNKNGGYVDDGRTLLHDYITEEELRACTTCQACVEECPVSISPLDIIVELRRHLIMEESSAPKEWNSMFSNIENNFAPWKFPPEDRDKWAEEIRRTT